jgi:hypothetical protein
MSLIGIELQSGNYYGVAGRILFVVEHCVEYPARRRRTALTNLCHANHRFRGNSAGLMCAIERIVRQEAAILSAYAKASA